MGQPKDTRPRNKEPKNTKGHRRRLTNVETERRAVTHVSPQPEFPLVTKLKTIKSPSLF